MSGIGFIVLGAAFFVSCVHAASVNDIFPRGVKICNRKESESSNCLRNSIQESWSSLVQGVPALQLPKLDPFHYDMVDEKLDTSLFTGRAEFSKLIIYGLSNAKFHAVRLQSVGDKMKLDVKASVPTFAVRGNYKALGTVKIPFSFNIKSNGQFSVNATDLSAVMRLVGNVKDDKWEVEHFHIQPKIEGMKVDLNDELNTYGMLMNVAVSMVNQSWRMFFEQLKPIFQTVVDPHVTKFVNRYVFSQVPISELVPV